MVSTGTSLPRWPSSSSVVRLARSIGELITRSGMIPSARIRFAAIATWRSPARVSPTSSSPVKVDVAL